MKDPRFNKIVYWPEWADSLIVDFISSLFLGSLIFTDHAQEKLSVTKTYAKKKESIINYLKDLELDYKKVFEFYLDKDNKVKKICHRDSLDHYYDIILVIAEDNKIVTFYINRSNYVHPNLSTELYVKDNNEDTTET